MRTVGYKVPRKTENGKQENQLPASSEQGKEKATSKAQSKETTPAKD